MRIRRAHARRARLAGVPIVTVEDGARQVAAKRTGLRLCSFAYHPSTRCWAKVAGDDFVHSNYASALQLGAPTSFGAAQSALSQLQATAMAQVNPLALLGQAAPSAERRNVVQRISRAHLEVQLAASQLLGGADEHARWLKMCVASLSVPLPGLCCAS